MPIFQLPSFQDLLKNSTMPLEPILFRFMRSTPMELTATSSVVIGAWGVVLAIANAFFLLLILIGAIQMMISHSTGTLSIPISEFVPKVLVTGLLMNLSYFFGQNLLSFNNMLCTAVDDRLEDFFRNITNGAGLVSLQGIVLTLAVVVFLNIGIIRLLFQALERIVLWNLLFVLSPLAFLCAFLPQTAALFSFWGRMFIVVTFTQFVQFLAFALAISLFAKAGQTGGLMSYLMAIAMLFMVGKVPDLLARFPSIAITNSQGIGRLVSTAIVAARLLAV